MPPPPFVDPQTFAGLEVQFAADEIRKRNPHRFEMELLHGVVAYRPDEGIIVGVHHSQEDHFWVRGHIPGRPLMPGVLLVETAAQLCSFYWRMTFPDNVKFFGFGGIENTFFRGTVRPGDDLFIAGRSVQIKPRRAIFDCQGFVDDKMVFETRIRGMPF